MLDTITFWHYTGFKMILTGDQLSKEPTELATNEEAIEIIRQLEKALHTSGQSSIGLAAPQIGINKAVAIVRIPNVDSNFDAIDPAEPIISINLVNPVLVQGNGYVLYEEGCLSFPGTYAKTVRFEQVVIESLDDYEYYASQVNTSRYRLKASDIPLFSDARRKIVFGRLDDRNPDVDKLSLLTSVCVQHEFSHLLGLTFYDFKPQEVGRNDKCPCGSGKKNKKCCSITYYNSNLVRLFRPEYRSV